MAGVPQGDPDLSPFLDNFQQNLSMEASEWPVELSAGILCHILNSVALRQLPALPAPSVPPPEWRQGMLEQKGLGGWEMSLALPVCLEGLAARAV